MNPRTGKKRRCWPQRQPVREDKLIKWKPFTKARDFLTQWWKPGDGQAIFLVAREDDHQLQGVPSRIVIGECKQNNFFLCKQQFKENNLVPSLKKNMEDIFKKEGKLYKKENLSYKAKMLNSIYMNKSKPAF